MIRSHAIRISIAVALVVIATGVVSRARDDAGDLIKRGKRALDAGRVAEADSSFARAAVLGRGDDHDEAVFLRAGVVRSGQEAETLYRELAEGNPDGRYADEARLELAKIQFATGRYEGAYGTLHDANACDHSEEACLFEGMSAVMLHRYNDAIPVLQNIRKGQAKVWATLSLAEAMDGAGQHDDACDRYEALARARVSPAAWYRYAECLEKRGDRDGARREYQALGSAFPQTPEAIRAAEKLNATAPATPPPAPEMAAPEAAPRSSGYTLQFGSFADRDNAMKLAADIKQTYPAVRIDSELINYKEVFRVRIGFYPTRDAARRAGEEMAKLINQPYTIMPVPSKP